MFQLEHVDKIESITKFNERAYNARLLLEPEN